MARACAAVEPAGILKKGFICLLLAASFVYSIGFFVAGKRGISAVSLHKQTDTHHLLPGQKRLLLHHSLHHHSDVRWGSFVPRFHVRKRSHPSRHHDTDHSQQQGITPKTAHVPNRDQPDNHETHFCMREPFVHLHRSETVSSRAKHNPPSLNETKWRRGTHYTKPHSQRAVFLSNRKAIERTKLTRIKYSLVSIAAAARLFAGDKWVSLHPRSLSQQHFSNMEGRCGAGYCRSRITTNDIKGNRTT